MQTETKTSVDKEWEITINGSVHAYHGTDAGMWRETSRLMANQPSGVIPTFREVNAPADSGNAITVAPSVAPVTSAPRTHSEAVQAGPDAEGAARSTVDLLAAQAAGFAPRQPFYDRGTPVIDLGVSNARASHREWEAMPKLAEAVDTFVTQIKREERHDVLVPLRQLAMRADGSLVGVDNARWSPEPDALVQLATRLHAPSPGYLREVWPQLRALNWNHLLATAAGLDKSTCPADHPLRKQLVGDDHVRARLRESAGGTALWAALSDSYACFDVDAIALALAQGLAAYGDARCEITYDGRGMQIDVLFHSDVKPTRYVAGEFFKCGYRIRTSDTGGGSIVVSLLLWQNLCLNLICLDVSTFTLARLRHIGDPKVLAERFSGAVREGEQRLGHFLRAWNFAEEQAVTVSDSEAVRLLDSVDAGDTLTDAEVLAGVFGGLRKADQLSITGDDIPGLLAAHALDTSAARELAPITRASVVNAITRYAHETVGRYNPAKQSELESQAGALLVSARGSKPAPLPLLPPKREMRLSL